MSLIKVENRLTWISAVIFKMKFNNLVLNIANKYEDNLDL